MHVRWLHLPLVFCALWLSLGTVHAQQTLYAATTDASGGNLYTIDPTSAAATLVGPILVGALPVGVTGLAFHPITGVLYAVTDHGSPNFPDSLITINPASGAATVIGSLGNILTDISFDSTGMLYGWLEPPPYNLVSINLTTGAASIIGPLGFMPFDSDGGLAFSPGGTLYLVSNEGSMACCAHTYVLRTVDKTTGATSSPQVLTLGGTDLVVNAMAFNSAGTLFASAVDSDGFSSLYTIDINTGVGTFVGSLPDAVTNAVAFTPAAPALLIRYFSNLNAGDSVINLSNSGVAGPPASICVNVYAFAPDEQPISCCSCPVTPNGLNSLSINHDLLGNVLTNSIPTSVVVKLVASTVPAGGCNAATVGTAGGGTPVTGMAAWGTTLHAAPTTPVSYRVTETPFTLATLNTAEVTNDASTCQFIGFLGSGYGICKSCRLGGMGADRR